MILQATASIYSCGPLTPLLEKLSILGGDFYSHKFAFFDKQHELIPQFPLVRSLDLEH